MVYGGYRDSVRPPGESGKRRARKGGACAGNQAAAFPLAASILAAPACGFGTPSQVMPGLAHPMASSESGFQVSDEATLHNYTGINVVLPDGWHTDIADNCLSPPEVGPAPGGNCPSEALRIRINASEEGLIDRRARS